MEDVLDTTFYHDDFLTRTLTTSTLYDKANLDLTFIDNNNIPRKSHDDEDNDADSPNLDFLKLGSPDLEQMFMSIDEASDDISNLDEDECSNVTTAAFNIEDDFVKADNCFTEALQQLHDKQTSISLELLDVKIKEERENDKRLKFQQEQRNKPEKASPVPVYRSRNKSQIKRHLSQPKHFYNDNAINNNSNLASKNLHRDVTVMSSSHHMQQNIPTGAVAAQAHMTYPDQMAINNQMALINSMSHTMNAHQLQQQQQEIAFLTQAMGYHADRDNMQSHIMNSGYPQHNSQVLPNHLEQKLLEQQMLQQQMNNGYPTNENAAMHTMHQLDSLAAMGIDEQTMKLFVENPHLAPINLEIQELIKRERKKLRNRVASSKCRKRKLEREGRLEDKVRILKEKNIELNAVANALKQQICDLKQRVMDHVGEGCQIVLPP